MTDILTELTKVAVFIFRSRDESDNAEPYWLQDQDKVLRGSYRASVLSLENLSKIASLVDIIFTDPDLSSLASRDDELDPMLLHPGGGSRISPDSLVISLFTSALLQMYCLRLRNDESTFVRTVIDNYEELRRAVKGEKIRAHIITGVAGITLQEGAKVSTPWGVVRPAPQVSQIQSFLSLHQPETSCILAEQRLIPIKIDRAASPEHTFDASDSVRSNSNHLLQLACVLASSEASNPTAPLMTWSTILLPFQMGFSHSSPHIISRYRKDEAIDDRISEIEEWARIINNTHVSTVDIAAQRLVSAIAHRPDRSDALIDAVMVWENLLGTSSEVTFRVSAALSKLIEDGVENRKSLRKELSDIYGVRSRLVHGTAIDQSKIDKACDDAIEVAVKALRISYGKGSDWLSKSSNERSDAILLE